MKTRDLKLEIKALDERGEFEGYASVFGNVDEGQDVILPGAFKEFVKTRDGKTLVLYQHRLGEPIGKADVDQDEKGLSFHGQLVMEDPVARKAHTHMKAGTLDGMSIGFDVLRGGAEFTDDGTRVLKALKLWEISVVTFGMNPLARIEAVKRAGQISTIREYEDLLRDECGFSNAQAKLLAAGGWKALQAARDEPGEAGAAQSLLDYLRHVANPKT